MRCVEPRQLHVNQRIVFENETPSNQWQESREIAERGAENAGAKAVDGVVRTKEAASPGPVKRKFEQQCEQKKRYSQHDEIHVAIVTSSAGFAVSCAAYSRTE